MEKDPHNLRKYEELYRLTKEGLQEERARSIRLDEKAERYLTVLTVLAGVGAVAGPTLFQALQPLKSFLDYAAIATSAAVLIVVVAAAWRTLRVLRIQAWRTLEINGEAIRLFVDNSYLNVIYSLTQDYVMTVKVNREKVTNRKAEQLGRAYGLIVLAFRLALLAIFVYVLAFVLSPD